MLHPGVVRVIVHCRHTVLYRNVFCRIVAEQFRPSRHEQPGQRCNRFMQGEGCSRRFRGVFRRGGYAFAALCPVSGYHDGTFVGMRGVVDRVLHVATREE